MYHRARKLNDCDGQSVYSAKRIDDIVIHIVKEYLEKIRTTPKDRALEIRYEREIDEKKRNKKRTWNQKKINIIKGWKSCQLIKSIKVKRGYELDIELNISYQQFFADIV